jgi:exosortase A
MRTLPLSRSRTAPALLMLLALLWLLALVLYRDTLATMVATWSESETFAHGFVVPPIALWLAWRRRADIAALAPTFAPAPSALLVVAAAGVAWLVGEAATVNALRQFALVTMLIALVPAVAGWPLARALMFPLGFLYFAVPFGEFLLPLLMRHTADFTVAALRATGIPVYRDGLEFVIPSGTWSVVEACSGVRYLIASAMGGALFAYLNYRSARRRALFMAFALALPIVANWLRAYFIVLIGHFSGNKLAVGIDHLIYGWLFFGVVIGVMFLVGMRWAEPEAPPVAAPAGASARATAASWRSAAAGVAALMVLALPPAAAWRAERAVELAAPRLAPPRSLAQLAPADAAALPEWQPAFSRPAASFNQRYAVGLQPVGLYVGYYRHQGADSKLVSSINMLVRSDDVHWNPVESGQRVLDTPLGAVPVHAARLRQRVGLGDGAEMTLWRLYWIDGAFEASDARAKLRGAWQRLRGRGDDGAALVLYTAAPTRAAADAALEAFVREHLLALHTQLRATRDGD